MLTARLKCLLLENIIIWNWRLLILFLKGFHESYSEFLENVDFISVSFLTERTKE